MNMSLSMAPNALKNTARNTNKVPLICTLPNSHKALENNPQRKQAEDDEAVSLYMCLFIFCLIRRRLGPSRRLSKSPCHCQSLSRPSSPSLSTDDSFCPTRCRGWGKWEFFLAVRSVFGTVCSLSLLLPAS